MEKLSLRYSGKAKSVYNTDDAHYVIVEFRNDATAFNGVKKAQFANKGMLNNYINAFIMEKLAAAGIRTHFVKIYSPTESIMKNLDMIRVECVVRNLAAGNLCKRLGIKEGLELKPPIFEFFLKSDELNDPPINESIIRTMGWATDKEIELMKQRTLQVNEILKALFLQAGILLVDYKLEFGRYQNDILLGDEFTPDGCRLWDTKTGKILDKDRFRKDLGDLIPAYKEVANRLGIKLTTAIS